MFRFQNGKKFKQISYLIWFKFQIEIIDFSKKLIKSVFFVKKKRKTSKNKT